jgi:glycosyltransferase domain-containing protein
MPKVTVAIPTYNRAHYLKEAIESVLNQTYTDYELLVVDNASTDNTEEVVKSFNDKRIKYIKNETNIGMVNNWNKCIDLAKGEYLIIFHDDDIMKPELLEKEVEILDNNEDVILVGCNKEYIDSNGNLINEREFKIYKDIIFKKYEFIKETCVSKIGISISSSMYRISLLKKNNLYYREKAQFGCDLYFLFELNSYDYKLYLLNCPLLKYRIHSEQLSTKKIDLAFKLYRNLYNLFNNNTELNYYLKKLATNNVLSAIIIDYIYGNIDKNRFKYYLKNLKNENYFIGYNLKNIIKLIMAYSLPKLTKYLHTLSLKG